MADNLIAEIQECMAWGLQASCLATICFGQDVSAALADRVREHWPDDYMTGWKQLDHDCLAWIRGADMPEPFTDLIPPRPIKEPS